LPNALNKTSLAPIPSPNSILSCPEESSIVSIPSPRLNVYLSLPLPPRSKSSPSLPFIISELSVPLMVSSSFVPNILVISAVFRDVPSKKFIFSNEYEDVCQSFTMILSVTSFIGLFSGFIYIAISEPLLLIVRSSLVIPSLKFRVSFPLLSTIISSPSPIE